jgi:hypothetical protein
MHAIKWYACLFEPWQWQRKANLEGWMSATLSETVAQSNIKLIPLWLAYILPPSDESHSQQGMVAAEPSSTCEALA